jgi:hypothetical protein
MNLLEGRILAVPANAWIAPGVLRYSGQTNGTACKLLKRKNRDSLLVRFSWLKLLNKSSDIALS